jgi:SGNH domain (fused to AT3 domains)
VGDCVYVADARRLCRRGDAEASKTLVVVGNSHGRHWISGIEKIARHSGYATYYLVKMKCTAALITPDLVTSDGPNDECVAFHTSMLDQVEELHPDLVLVSSSGTDGGVYTDDGRHLTKRDDVNQALGEGFGELFERLAPLTDRLVLLDDIPKVHGTMSDCLASDPDGLAECLDSPRADKAAQTRVAGTAADQHGVERIDTYPWFCDRGKCPAVIGDTIPYRDSGHMTNEYSLRLAQPLGEALGIW